MELLDKKGLTTVWAAIKNTFTSKSDADEKYANKTDLADYATKSQAMNSMDVYHTATDIQISLNGVNDFPLGFIAINAVTSQSAGVMIPSDKKKLDGIASGANNYTLPTASATALGGIKTGFGNKTGIDWEVNVDEQGNAYASIGGLYCNLKGKIAYIDIDGDNLYVPTTRYRNNGISSGLPGKQANFTFPSKSGTLALTSDCGSLVMNGGIVNNNIGFNSYKQNVLISQSGNYNISNWYNSSPVGSVMDIYPYAEINGTITANDKYIFQTMGTSSTGSPIIVTKKSINLSNSHYIRLIHIDDGVYVCVSILGY